MDYYTIPCNTLPYNTMEYCIVLQWNMTQGPRPIRRRGNSVFADKRHLGDPSCASFEHLLGFATVIVIVDEEMDEMVDGEVELDMMQFQYW